VRDGADVSGLLDGEYLDRRRADLPQAVTEARGGTVYLSVVDGERMAVSFIQSLYGSFGSGVMVPATGILLQNRGAGFAVQGEIVPGARPFHTIIPGLLLRDGQLAGPFGVMGGPIQAQAHVQLVSALVDAELDPQAALDQPRFCVDGDYVRLEEGLWGFEHELAMSGHQPILEQDTLVFGGGQAIMVEGDALLGGSDSRKDGYAAGF
jgi:gamma-glutamyltranspeptidase/glutathione hydrolase